MTSTTNLPSAGASRRVVSSTADPGARLARLERMVRLLWQIHNTTSEKEHLKLIEMLRSYQEERKV